jgi:hypothetical protein
VGGSHTYMTPLASACSSISIPYGLVYRYRTSIGMEHEAQALQVNITFHDVPLLAEVAKAPHFHKQTIWQPISQCHG